MGSDLTKSQSGQQSVTSTAHQKKSYSKKLSQSLTTEQRNNYTGQLGRNLTNKQSYNVATAPRKYNNHQRRNLEGQPNIQLDSFFTYEQRKSDSGHLGNLTTEEDYFTQRRSRNLAVRAKSPNHKRGTLPIFFNEQQNNLLAAEQEKSESEQLSDNLTNEQEKCYDPEDTTLTFADADDDMDFLCNDYKSLRAKMSCGHTVTPMSLTDWCRWLLDEGECSFVCGMHGCNAEWPYEEVQKMALLTPEETEYFEKKLFSNASRDFLNVKLCPGCKCSVVRRDLNNLRVCCTVCTANKKRSYEFCWQCLEEWKRPSPYSDRCANAGCINKPLELLRTCPDITFKDVSGVTGCPSIRACPTCGLLVEHNKKQCKTIVCRRCYVKFCFVCLKLAEECGKHVYTHCSSGVAPRQTSIPVWQRK